MPTDSLCLGSGHNDLSKMLADYLLLKFNYEIDVVSIYYFSTEALEYSYYKEMFCYTYTIFNETFTYNISLTTHYRVLQEIST